MNKIESFSPAPPEIKFFIFLTFFIEFNFLIYYNKKLWLGNAGSSLSSLEFRGKARWLNARLVYVFLQSV